MHLSAFRRRYFQCNSPLSFDVLQTCITICTSIHEGDMGRAHRILNPQQQGSGHQQRTKNAFRLSMPASMPMYEGMRACMYVLSPALTVPAPKNTSLAATCLHCTPGTTSLPQTQLAQEIARLKGYELESCRAYSCRE